MGKDRDIELLQAQMGVLEARLNLLESKITTLESITQPTNDMISAAFDLAKMASADCYVTTLMTALLGIWMTSNENFGIDQKTLLTSAQNYINSLPEHIRESGGHSIETITHFWGED